MSDILTKLQAAGAFVDQSDKGGRGRPRKAWHQSKDCQIAKEVFYTEMLLGSKRGNYMSACYIVAERQQISVEAVRKAAQRKRSVRGLIHSRRTIEDDVSEIERRTKMFPENDLAYLHEKLTAAGLLSLLRDNNINGDLPPQWLAHTIGKLRQKDFLSPKS